MSRRTLDSREPAAEVHNKGQEESTLVLGRSWSWAMLLGSAATACLLLTSPDRNQRDVALSLGVLTPHERMLFNRYQILHRHHLHRMQHLIQSSAQGSGGDSDSGATAAAKVASAAIAPAPHHSQLDLIPSTGAGDAVGPSADSNERTTFGFGLNHCEGCQGDGLNLPLYDNDGMDFLAAMQKQDKMITEQQQEKEERDKAIRSGQQVAPLLPVTCGNTCFAAKGVWCCRIKKR